MPSTTRITPFQLNENETVWIEVQELPVDDGNGRQEKADRVPGRGITRAARSGEGDDEGEDTETPPEPRLQEAIGRIRPAVNAVLDALREINTPKEIEIELGIGFSGKVGAFIASADTST